MYTSSLGLTGPISSYRSTLSPSTPYTASWATLHMLPCSFALSSLRHGLDSIFRQAYPEPANFGAASNTFHQHCNQHLTSIGISGSKNTVYSYYGIGRAYGKKIMV